MFNSTVFSFGVLPDQNSVDVVIGSLVAGDRNTGTDVSKKVECTAKSEIERDMAFSDRSLVWHQPRHTCDRRPRNLPLEVL